MTSTEPDASDPSGQVPGTGTDSGSSAAEESGAGAPASPAPTSTGPTGFGDSEMQALQLALRTENAALWSYGLVAANSPKDQSTVTEMRESHLVRRDATASLLIDNGAEPEPPAVAYATPAAKDRKTALVLAFSIEADCQEAWRNVVATTDNNDLRKLATSALTEAAVRYTQWKTVAKSGIRTTPFPGRPKTD